MEKFEVGSCSSDEKICEGAMAMPNADFDDFMNVIPDCIRRYGVSQRPIPSIWEEAANISPNSKRILFDILEKKLNLTKPIQDPSVSDKTDVTNKQKEISQNINIIDGAEADDEQSLKSNEDEPIPVLNCPDELKYIANIVGPKVFGRRHISVTSSEDDRGDINNIFRVYEDHAIQTLPPQRQLNQQRKYENFKPKFLKKRKRRCDTEENAWHHILQQSEYICDSDHEYNESMKFRLSKIIDGKTER